MDGGFLGLDEEFAGAADAEGIVRRGGAGAGNAERIFVDDVLVGLGIALSVVHVPAKGGEEWVDEFLADPCLLVVGVNVGIEVATEGLDTLKNALRNRHEGARQQNRAGLPRQGRSGWTHREGAFLPFSFGHAGAT